MAYHARLSPSSAARWTSCTASPAEQDGRPNTSSEDARIGTCGHQIHEECLLDPERDLQAYLGRKMLFWIHPESDSSGEDWSEDLNELSLGVEVLYEVVVTDELLDAVAASLAFVRQRVALSGGELLVEQRAPISQFTGEKGASGSADVVIVAPPVLQVLDLKLGRHKVFAYEVLQPAGRDIITGETTPEVVRPNLQMASYALGMLEELSMFYEFTHVTLTISQPVIGHVSEFTCTVDELRQTEQFLREKAEETRSNPRYVPTASNCHYCRASGDCAAQTKVVTDAALDGFEDLASAKVRDAPSVRLGTAYALIPLISRWCDDVAARTKQALLEGKPVVRDDGLAYKMVEGRDAARTWTDANEVDIVMRDKMRLRYDQRYNLSVISPAQAEKLAKSKRVKKGEPKVPPVIGPTQWKRLQDFITQGKTQPAIALETDPRPAVALRTDGFEEVPSQDNSDLF